MRLRFVEFETGVDLKTAVEKLDGREFKTVTVHCTADVSAGYPIRITDRADLLTQIYPQIQEDRPTDKPYRTRSPGPRGRNYGPPGADGYYDRRGPPPRDFSPRGYNRERSPRGRTDDYYGRDYSRRTPPRGDPYGPPPPRRGPYDYDPYSRGAPPPPPRGYADPYARNGDPYARPRSPRGYGSYGGYGDDYERRHW